jgi:hypothetical protein
MELLQRLAQMASGSLGNWKSWRARSGACRNPGLRAHSGNHFEQVIEVRELFVPCRVTDWSATWMMRPDRGRKTWS